MVPASWESNRLLWILFTALAIYLPVALSSPFRCAHGKFISKTQGCECDVNFTGPICIREMHCGSYDRQENGSCVECDDHWSGPDCDIITCGENGAPNSDKQRCKCQDPFSGFYCEKLKTEDVYSYYNGISNVIGPLGIISIIPMSLLVYFCNKKADARKNEKAQNQLGEYLAMQKDAIIIKKLLDERVEEEDEGLLASNGQSSR